MKYIKTYNESKEESIESICKSNGISDSQNYTNNPDGSVNVVSNVFLANRKITKLPLKFNKVDGTFWCHGNRLISLEGSPKIVGKHFDCSDNQLTTLEGGPKIVGEHFDCSENRLTTLEGAPERVGGDFYCTDNNQLTTLEGAPERVGGNFDCRNNNLRSVKGFPEDFEGDLYIFGNPVYEIFELFKLSISMVPNYKIAQLLNEYDVISQDGKKIYSDNIEEVFIIIGEKIIPKDIKLRNYEIH